MKFFHSVRLRAAAGSQAGQMLVLAVPIVLFLLAVCVLTVDVGLLFCMRARLQNAADAGSLAAVLELMQQKKAGCCEDEARCHAQTEAGQIVGANTPGTSVHVMFGILDEDGQFVEQDSSVDATAAQVTVSRDEYGAAGPVPLCFAPLFGLAQKEVHALAVARRSSNIVRIHKGMRPFVVSTGNVLPAGEVMTIYDQELVAPGCFGFLDFNGGSHGIPELRDWIVNGYDAAFGIDPQTGYAMVNGATGFRAALKDATEEMIVEDASDQTSGKEIVIAVYDQVTGTGADAYFRVVGFLSVTVVEASFTGEEKYIRLRVNNMGNIHGADVGALGQSDNLYRIQIVM